MYTNNSRLGRALVALLLLLTLLLLSACAQGNTQTLTTGELTYTLPSYIKKFPLADSDAAYKNTGDKVFIFIHVIDENDLGKEGLSVDVTVEEYVTHFISKNGFDEGGMELDLEYNEAKTKVSFDVVIGSAPGEEASDEENVLQYYYYTFVRGTNAIYVSQMLCAESDATSYVGLFKEWSASMKAS